MLTRILFPILILLIFAYGFLDAGFARLPPHFSIASATPSPSPMSWPDLDKLKNPDGTTCGLSGAPKGSAERGAQNRLRNRYHLPDHGFEPLTLEDLLKLLQGEIDDRNRLINYPLSSDRNHERAVAIVGYVTDVLVLGCGAADTKGDIITEVPLPKRKGVESANCFVNDPGLCTAQIFITSDPNLPLEGGRNLFVVTVTRRSRFLAKRELLISNIGNDWSTQVLREKIWKHWVRFSGWLFFNQNYRDRGWAIDPSDKIGKPNDRQSAWGLHPVMGIEVDVPPAK
jgi:hypothetical protein